MIKKWNDYNEEISWPWKKETDNPQPKGPTFSSEVRPEGGRNVEFSDVKPLPPKKDPLTTYKVDTDIMQEISDRLYGPDSEEYVNAVLALHDMKNTDGSLKFGKREGRWGRQLGDKESEKREEERKKRQQEIINRFK